WRGTGWPRSPPRASSSGSSTPSWRQRRDPLGGGAGAAAVRCDGVYIPGTATWLPPAMIPADAVAAGVADEAMAEVTGQVSVAVAGAESGPEMAALAGEKALARSGLRPDEIALVLYAGVFYSGHDMWAPASFVQHAAV